jgi:hypothetical protein
MRLDPVGRIAHVWEQKAGPRIQPIIQIQRRQLRESIYATEFPHSNVSQTQGSERSTARNLTCR